VTIDHDEALGIASRISPIFDEVSASYDFTKYPYADYVKFKEVFSSKPLMNNEIADALLWKWGNWGKRNYPKRHRDLIQEIQYLWPAFIDSGCGDTSRRTYEWWLKKLNRHTAYITVAYITHLIHHREPFPIIDQHNFRGMNALLRDFRGFDTANKKPSQWQDIMKLRDFINAIVKAMGNRSSEEIDRFLMMYGKNHVKR
jgi:hypothetical protein